jgi:hypothetical protein
MLTHSLPVVPDGARVEDPHAPIRDPCRSWRAGPDRSRLALPRALPAGSLAGTTLEGDPI